MANEITIGSLVRITTLPNNPSDNVVRCHGGGWLGMVENVTATNVELQIPAKVSDSGSLPIFHHMGVEKIKLPKENVEVVADVANIE